MFDFTSLFSAQCSVRLVERYDQRLLMAIVGDTLHEVIGDYIKFDFVFDFGINIETKNFLSCSRISKKRSHLLPSLRKFSNAEIIFNIIWQATLEVKVLLAFFLKLIEALFFLTEEKLKSLLEVSYENNDFLSAKFVLLFFFYVILIHFYDYLSNFTQSFIAIMKFNSGT